METRHNELTNRRVGDLFPRKWLNGQSLPGPLLVRLVGLETATVMPRPGAPPETAHVLRFEVLDAQTRQPRALPGHERNQAGYGLILTRRLAQQIAQAVGTDALDAWAGRVVVFEPGTWAGKRIVNVRAARADSAGR